VNTHKEGHMVAQNKYGHAVDMKSAMADPQNSTVQIGNMRVSVEVALRQGLISDTGEFNRACIEPPKPTPAAPQQSFISEQGQNFIKQATQRVPKPIFDAAVAKVFVASGNSAKVVATVCLNEWKVLFCAIPIFPTGCIINRVDHCFFVHKVNKRVPENLIIRDCARFPVSRLLSPIFSDHFTDGF